LGFVTREARQLGVERFIERRRPVIVPCTRFRLVGAAEVVPWEAAGLWDLDRRTSRRVARRVIMPFDALIAH
jgi:hypothetical protein